MSNSVTLKLLKKPNENLQKPRAQMGWAKSVSPNGMGRNGMGPIDVWAQIGRAQTGWAESGGYLKKTDVRKIILVQKQLSYDPLNRFSFFQR